jgi:hypothetical protein
MKDIPFVGFASIDMSDGISRKFRTEALAIAETLEIIGEIDSEQNLMILSDPASVFNGISNLSTMSNTSHITQMLKEGRDSQLLLLVADLKTQWKKKGKENLHRFCQITKRDSGESYHERYYRYGSSPWFREI